MSKDGGTPWPVWAAVTLLVAVIGTFGKLWVDRSSSSAPNDVERSVGVAEKAQLPAQAQSLAPPATTPEQIDWTTRLGLYAGESINRLSYNRGATLLDLKSIEPSGMIRGAIEWSQGLSGSGTLVGTTSANTVDLSGTILSDVTGTWECEVRLTFESADSIRGTYRLFPRPGNPNGTQDGEFTLTKTR